MEECAFDDDAKVVINFGCWFHSPELTSIVDAEKLKYFFSYLFQLWFWLRSLGSTSFVDTTELEYFSVIYVNFGCWLHSLGSRLRGFKWVSLVLKNVVVILDGRYNQYVVWRKWYLCICISNIVLLISNLPLFCKLLSSHYL